MSGAVSPSSPRVELVQLSDCIETTLKYVLSSVKDGTLGAHDLGLSNQCCSELLIDDPSEDNLPNAENQSIRGGVPPYPLYKCVARTLSQCITDGTSLRTSCSLETIEENESSKKQEKEWNRLIAEKGSELVHMLKITEFELHVQEPFFTQLRDGLKLVEGRCAVGNYNRIGPGSLLLINKCLLLEVQLVRKYPSFSTMMEVEGLSKVLPGVATIEDGVKVYRRFYTEEKEMSNGVLAISVSRSTSQPYISIMSILFGLAYGGIGSTLGLVQTAGTVMEALPPPRSNLLSSFMMPYKLKEVKGGILTSGARALSKHVGRSADGWWGSFVGNDSDKNDVALRVVNHIISNACWLNIHTIQPYDRVFEARVAEGYGARWSQDGSKFIGFLEPYMEDGYSRGWKH